MNRQITRIVVLTAVVSGMLFGIGVSAAWNVQRTQVQSSDVINRELHSMLAAFDLYLNMREVRNDLQQYLREHDPKLLDDVAALDPQKNERLPVAISLARSTDRQQMLTTLRGTIHDFFDDFYRLKGQSDPGTAAFDHEIGRLIDGPLGRDVLIPARKYVEIHRQIADQTNTHSRQTNNEMRRAFLLLGICGGAGGIVAGASIARTLSRTIVELDISIQGVAGRLQPILGRVDISRIGELKEIETGLQQLEDHIVAVVERLQQRELEILRTEQLAAIGQLAAGMAHELRNPLMPMKMLVQAALERNDSTGLQGRNLEVVYEEINRLEYAIQEFLDFARPPKLEKCQLDLRTILEQTQQLLSSQASRQQIQLVIDVPSAPVLVEADAVQIRQVVLNLLRNALEAQPVGGQINLTLTIATQSVPRSDAGEERGTRPAVDHWAELRVRDYGRGLAADIVPRLYEPFATTKETGTGLGLTVSKRIVEDHGGRIRGRNCDPAGCEFLVQLPMVSPANVAEPRPSSQERKAIPHE